MLDLRRLRLLRELHERGTIAAVADALQFTPSAVSQQLSMLEREAGVPLIERAGRGVRLTDTGLVLVGHADALLERVALAEADLAAAEGVVAGRARIAGFESVSLRPGRKARVRFHLDSRAFSYWNTRRDRWQVAPGCYRVLVGASSRNIAARAVIAMRGGSCPG